jgi:hypothetical protein
MPDDSSEFREFLIVLRRALLMIVRYIETRYHIAE